MHITRSILIFILGASVGIFGTLTFSYIILSQDFYIQKLYYSLPGAVVGLISLIWNMYNQAKISTLSKSNEQKAYALASFDNYVAEPVREAINSIDQLMAKIEQALHEKPSGDKNVKARLNNIIDCEVMLYITRSYRLCGEADQYMKQENLESKFIQHMYYISDDEKLDDLVLINLGDAAQSSQPKIVLDAKMRKIEEVITQKKAYIRSQLAKASREIAVFYDK